MIDIEYGFMYDCYMLDGSDMYMDDLPIDCKNKEESFLIFVRLPRHVRFCGIENGLNDTCFRDLVFEYLCEKLFDMSCEEYYNSEIFKGYMELGKVVEIDYSKLTG